MQPHLFDQRIGRCGRLAVIRDGFTRDSPSITSTLHASKVADHLRKPWP
jgi:hypothetical protein